MASQAAPHLHVLQTEASSETSTALLFQLFSSISHVHIVFVERQHLTSGGKREANVFRARINLIIVRIEFLGDGQKSFTNMRIRHVKTFVHQNVIDQLVELLWQLLNDLHTSLLIDVRYSIERYLIGQIERVDKRRKHMQRMCVERATMKRIATGQLLFYQ
jgi:hypothetical protein